MKTKKVNKILLIHGIFLSIVTIANTVGALVGVYAGKGVFFFLKANPMAEVGLFQAYLLMLLMGIVLLLNIKTENSWRYDIIGALAHLIPLSALFIFQDVVKEVMGEKIFVASAFIHIPWILIEFITAFIIYKKSNDNKI